MVPFKTRLQQLLASYLEPQTHTFRRFKLGAGLFVCGLVIIYVSSESMLPGVEQELATLGGLILVGIGFLTALMAEIRLLISRLIQFWMR